MTPNNSKSYLGYLNKLVDECNNSYLFCIVKHFFHAQYSFFSVDFESSYKAPKFKFGDRVMITKNKNIFSKS